MKRKIILSLLTLVFLFGIIYSLSKIITWKKDVDTNTKIQVKLEEYINKDKVEFNTLKKKNEDTIAIIKVNNTNINYVVVKGNDNEYYLNHNFNKEKNVAGWIFADYRNKVDETDKNLVIYGHNMKDGSMFDSLINVLKKEWYTNEDNHIVKLITEKGYYNYKVFSSYSIKAEDYYINTDFNNDEEYKKFLNTIKNRSIYNYNEEVNESDKILTLSSCIGDGKNRVVLHSKLIDKEDF